MAVAGIVRGAPWLGKVGQSFVSGKDEAGFTQPDRVVAAASVRFVTQNELRNETVRGLHLETCANPGGTTDSSLA